MKKPPEEANTFNDPVQAALCEMMLESGYEAIALKSATDAVDCANAVLALYPSHREAKALLASGRRAIAIDALQARHRGWRSVFVRVAALAGLVLASPVVVVTYCCLWLAFGRQNVYAVYLSSDAVPSIPRLFRTTGQSGNVSFWGGALRYSGVDRLPALYDVWTGACGYRRALSDSTKKARFVQQVANHVIILCTCASWLVFFLPDLRPPVAEYWVNAVSSMDWVPLFVFVCFPLFGGLQLLLFRQWLGLRQRDASLGLGETTAVASLVGIVALLLVVFAPIVRIVG